MYPPNHHKLRDLSTFICFFKKRLWRELNSLYKALQEILQTFQKQFCRFCLLMVTNEEKYAIIQHSIKAFFRV